jgi:hypothetical protein
MKLRIAALSSLFFVACGGPAGPSQIPSSLAEQPAVTANDLRSTPTPTPTLLATPTPAPRVTPSPTPTPESTPAPTPEVTPQPDVRRCASGTPQFGDAIARAQTGLPVNIGVDAYTGALVSFIRLEGLSAAVAGPGLVYAKLGSINSETWRVFVPLSGPTLQYVETCYPSRF